MFIAASIYTFFLKFIGRKFVHGYSIPPQHLLSLHLSLHLIMNSNFSLLFVSFVIYQYDHWEIFRINYRQNKAHGDYLRRQHRSIRILDLFTQLKKNTW
jgi:hypothetical protein